MIELSLSVDNLFVFLLIFRFFQVPPDPTSTKCCSGEFWGADHSRNLHRGRSWADSKAATGSPTCSARFLVYSGIKLFRQDGRRDPSRKNPVLRLFRTLGAGDRGLRRQQVFRAASRLVRHAAADCAGSGRNHRCVFAVDSIPAILAITRNAFIVYTSNVFAILGLRSMYFALAGMMETFRYLHYGLALILMFVGTMMLLSHYYQIPTVVALGGVAGVLLISVLASVVNPQKKLGSS